MEYKYLGNSKIQIPSIGQGTGEYIIQNSQDSCNLYVDIIKKCIDFGMKFIDTAEVYGKGYSETIVGKAIKDCRDKVIISTKVSPEHLSHDSVIKAAEGSLCRLQTDYIDLYQIHWPNPTVYLEETLTAMEQLIEEGKIRYIGVCNFSLKELKLAKSILKDKIVSNQVEYNLFDRTIEDDILPYCEKEKITIMAYSPLDKGNFIGKEKIEMVAKKYGRTISQIILRWLTHKPSIVAISRSSNVEHIRENALSTDFDLYPEDIEFIDENFKHDCVDISMDEIKVDSENLDRFVPSHIDLAKSICDGIILKPIKVKSIEKYIPKNVPNKYRFELLEGKIRYWAWYVAYDGKRPIKSLIRY